MSELKLTAVEGLRTQDEAWDDFYTGEDIKQQIKEETETKTESENYPDDFDKEEETREKEEEEREKSDSDANQEETAVTNDTRDPSDEAAPEKSSRSKAKRHKKSKTKKSKPPKNRSPSPSHSKPHYPRGKSPAAQYIVQQTAEQSQQRGRRLTRRRQMRNEHLLEQVEQAGRERLEQKYMELEELMTRPLVDTQKRMSSQRLHRVVNMQRQHAQNGYGEQEPEGGLDRQAYSTIRVLQDSGRSVQLKISYSPRSHNSPQSGNHHIPSTLQHSSRGSVDSPTTSSSGRSHSRNENHFYSSEGEESGRSDDEDTQRAYLPTDTFLRNTDNPKLQEWIKRKDAEHRRARKAERIKKREERNDKMVEDELKKARREKSSERVKQWMEVKRKEVLLRQKVERQRRKQEEAEQRKRAKSQESALHGTRIDRPRTAPTQKSSYVLIKRPNSAAKLDDGKGSNSKPPDTKFVYKRKVTGRVQLMKIQNERNARARSADEQRYDELSAEERQEKAQTSYDSWLLAKKKQDIENRKAAKKQKQSMQSDPEMERIIPEMARRRIERIKNGKKTLDTGLNRSTASSGGEEAETQAQETQEGEENGNEETSPSEQLTVSGMAATLTSTNKRPTSARMRTPKPPKAVSPSRPKSASAAKSSRQKAKSGTETPSASQSSSFKLPFPDELGVPYHVKQMQEKIFSKELTSQSDNHERPEPQGCASVESASCPKGLSQMSNSSTNPQTNLILLQEIEAEAVESEQATEEATLMAVQNAIKNAAKSAGEEDGEKENEEAQEAGESTEEPGEEPNQNLEECAGEEKDDDQEQQPEQVTENSEETVEELEHPAEETEAGENLEDQTEEAEAGEELDDQTEEAEAGEELEDQVEEAETGELEKNEAEDTEEKDGEEAGDEAQPAEEGEDAADDNHQPEEETPADGEEDMQQAEETLTAGEENVADFTEESEPPIIPEVEEATETTVEEKEEEEIPDTAFFDQEESADKAEDDEGAAQEIQDDDLNDSLRKSDKRVSFCEELATVYGPSPDETCSSFEDERGFGDDVSNTE